MDKNSEDYIVLQKTVFGEARGEPEEGQRAVAWVIKNRADLNRSYWGGSIIANVCRHPQQFECWLPAKMRENENALRTRAGQAENDAIDVWLPKVYRGIDPSLGSDHFNNPDKEGEPAWTRNCNKTVRIGGHQFYKSFS